MALLSERLFQPSKKPPARAILRGEHADAGAAANDIWVVEKVDDIEAERDRLAPGRRKFMRQTQVHLSVGRDMIGVGEAAA